MIQRICPVCDKVMKSVHYCSNCKSWVKHPFVMEVDFYLNERHPENESGCTYHSRGERKYIEAGQEPVRPQDGSRRQAGASPQTMPQTPAPFPARTPLPPGNIPCQQKGKGRENAGRGRSGSRAAAAIVVVAAMVSILPVFSGKMLRAIERVMEPPIEYDIDLGDYTGEAGNSDYQELEDSEVIARGEGCNSAGHFTVKGINLEQPILDILEQAGYQLKRQDTYSYNEVFQDGETWYRTWVTIEVEGNGDSGYQFVELDSDTGTGRLHEINVSLDDPVRLTEVTCAILEALAQEGELPEDADCIASVAEELQEAFADGIGYHIMEGPVQIEGIAYENRYSVYISHEIDSDL